MAEVRIVDLLPHFRKTYIDIIKLKSLNEEERYHLRQYKNDLNLIELFAAGMEKIYQEIPGIMRNKFKDFTHQYLSNPEPFYVNNEYKDLDKIYDFFTKKISEERPKSATETIYLIKEITNSSECKLYRESLNNELKSNIDDKEFIDYNNFDKKDGMISIKHQLVEIYKPIIEYETNKLKEGRKRAIRSTYLKTDFSNFSQEFQQYLQKFLLILDSMNLKELRYDRAGKKEDEDTWNNQYNKAKKYLYLINRSLSSIIKAKKAKAFDGQDSEIIMKSMMEFIRINQELESTEIIQKKSLYDKYQNDLNELIKIVEDLINNRN